MKDNTLGYEECRIMIARELRIPPDDINLRPILQSAFRSIRENCEGMSNEFIITIKDKEEEEAILSEHGQMIIRRIFEFEKPFKNLVQDYSEWYTSAFLDGDPS